MNASKATKFRTYTAPSSRGDRTYDVTLYTHGGPREGYSWFCSCPAFKFQRRPVTARSCKHTDRIEARANFALKHQVPFGTADKAARSKLPKLSTAMLRTLLHVQSVISIHSSDLPGATLAALVKRGLVELDIQEAYISSLGILAVAAACNR